MIWRSWQADFLERPAGPGGHELAGSLHLCIQSPAAGLQTGQKQPEARRMIEMHRVAEFVNHDVVHQMRRQKEQFVVQADGSPAGATAPSGFLPANLGGPEGKSGLVAELPEPWDKMKAALSLQPQPQQSQAASLIAGIATQFEL